MAANVLAAQKRAIKEKLQSTQEAKKREAQFAKVSEKLNKANLLAATKLTIPVVKKDLFRMLLVAPQSSFHQVWDLFIMICALYNGVTLPIDISFSPDWMKLKSINFLNTIIDISFLFDILIVFRTTITGLDGEENTDQKEIAKNYLKGAFFIDIMSTIPMDSLASTFLEDSVASNFALFGALKLIRVTRLGRIIRGMSVNRTTKGQLKLFKLMFMLCLYVHVVGCMWYYFCVRSMTWVPPQDTIYSDPSERPFWRLGLFDQYWYCIYTSLQFLSCNDISPQGTDMVAFGAFANLGGALVTANLFGELAILVSDLGRNQTRYQKKVDIANQAMQNLHLPMSVQNSVLSYMMSTKASQDSQDEFKEFAILISPSLQAQITRSLFTLICKCSKLLGPELGDRLLLEELGFIGAMLQPVEQCPEDIVIQQGDKSTSIFFILKGRLRVKIVNNFNGQVQMMPELDKYQIFGEVSYVLKVPRTATVQCDNYASLMQLHVADGYNFNKFIELCKHQFFQYNENFLIFAKKLLKRSVQWLDDQIVDDNLLQSICYNLKLHKFKKGQVILFEGQQIKDVLIIQNGFIDLTFKTSLIETSCIQRLYPGCTYGSYTFFVDEESDHRHSKFNLTANTDGSYLALSFQSLFSIGIVDDKMTDLIVKYRLQLIDNGFPLCDFNLFRVNLREKRKVNEVFIQALRKVFLLNKRKRAKLEMLQRLIVEARENKERLMQYQLPKKLQHQLSTKVYQYFLQNSVDIVGPLEQCQQEMLSYQESVTRAFAFVQQELNKNLGNHRELVHNILNQQL